MNILKKEILKLLLKEMQKQYANKDYSSELKTLNWIILLNPIASNYSLRGDVYGLLGNYKKAIEDKSTAISMTPTDFELYSSRAYLNSKQMNHDLAIDDYTKAIELKPDDDGLFL